jgi:hypothetical protein
VAQGGTRPAHGGAACTQPGTHNTCSGAAAARGARGVAQPSKRHQRPTDKEFTVRTRVPRGTHLATSWALARTEEEGGVRAVAHWRGDDVPVQDGDAVVGEGPG